MYRTSDGREYSNYSVAKLHEDNLNGSKKDCPECKGKGRVNGRWEKLIYDYGHSSEDVHRSDLCTKCDGKGYLELKWS